MEEKIRELLEKNDRTPAWLARKMGYNEQTIYRKLSGQRDVTKCEMFAICYIFGVDESFFSDANI